LLIHPKENDYPNYIFNQEDPRQGIEECAFAYFRTNPIVRKTFLRRVERALAMVPNAQLERALDVGTGIGFLIPSLTSRASTVVGVDYSPIISNATRFMLASRNIANAALCRAEAQRLPFPSDTFDLVTCLSMMEHIPEPAKAFQELSRVLTGDGIAIVGWPIENLFLKLVRQVEFRLLRPKMFNRLTRMKEHGETGWHVTNWKKIEASIDPYFSIERKITMRFFFPIYRIMSLRKKQRPVA